MISVIDDWVCMLSGLHKVLSFRLQTEGLGKHSPKNHQISFRLIKLANNASTTYFFDKMQACSLF